MSARCCCSNPSLMLLLVAMLLICGSFCAAPYYLHRHQWVTHMDDERQVLVFERGPLVFVFNWSPHKDYEGLKVGAGGVVFPTIRRFIFC